MEILLNLNGIAITKASNGKHPLSPSSTSLGCMSCVSVISKRPSFFYQYRLLSICHVPDATEGTLHELPPILRVKIVGTLVRVQRFLKDVDGIRTLSTTSQRNFSKVL